jgi:HSP20 family molecular chaperone IbpA
MAPFAAIAHFHTIPSALIASFMHSLDVVKEHVKFLNPVYHLIDYNSVGFMETPLGYLLELILPRFKKNDLRVELYKIREDYEMRISGNLNSKSFSQQWKLPNDADPESMEAYLADGVLSIRVNKIIPEPEHETPLIRTIHIN